MSLGAPGPRARIAGAQPLFLIGAPRSGTTFLSRLLNAHPGLLMTNETAVILQLHEMIHNSRRGARAGLLFGRSYHTLWADHLHARARELIESYYARIAELEGKEDLAYWGEKHPHHGQCMDFIAGLFPEARYIYIVRDPRDASCSIASMNRWGFSRSLRAYCQLAGDYEACFPRLDAAARLTVRYEDLVRDTGTVMGGIFKWLNIDYPAEFDAHLQHWQKVDAHRPEAIGSRKRSFEHESIGRWKRELTWWEKQFAEVTAGSLLDRWKYERWHPSSAERWRGLLPWLRRCCLIVVANGLRAARRLHQDLSFWLGLRRPRWSARSHDQDPGQ